LYWPGTGAPTISHEQPQSPDEPNGPDDDHLAELFFKSDGASSGRYRPSGFELNLDGTDDVQDDVVFLHEAHHGSLNDSTSWGTALHVYARLPDTNPPEIFLSLLNASRTVHESYATFASVNIASARHVGAEVVLSRYPAYLPLLESTAALVEHIGGQHRRFLAVSAIARFAMQTRILDAMIDHYQELQLSEFRELERPDGRWHSVMARPEAVAEAANRTDDLTRQRFGPNCLYVDQSDSDPYAAIEDDLDDMWGYWERTFYSELGVILTQAGMAALDFDGHVDLARQVLDIVRADYPTVELRAAASITAPDDGALAGAVIAQARHNFVVPPWYAALADIPIAELVDVLDGRRIADVPILVADVRLATRLLTLFRWGPADEQRLRSHHRAMLTLRVDAFSEDGEDFILQRPVVTIDQLHDIEREWAGRSPIRSVVSVSCLADGQWTEQWLAPLRALGPQVMLIDTDPTRFVSNWRGRALRAARLDVADTAGSRVALALHASGIPSIWLGIGSKAYIALMEQQMVGLGVEIQWDQAFLADWSDTLRVVLTHLLATESFVDLNGLDGYL
jgi:hypothetical protein